MSDSSFDEEIAALLLDLCAVCTAPCCCAAAAALCRPCTPSAGWAAEINSPSSETLWNALEASVNVDVIALRLCRPRCLLPRVQMLLDGELQTEARPR